MRSSSLVHAALFAVLSTAKTYTPFVITNLNNDEPQGVPDGQVNFWHISFNIDSANDHNITSNSSTYCHSYWGDAGANTIPHDANLWISCDNPQYSFMLFDDYTVENFTFAVQQNITSIDGETILISGETLVSDSTPRWTCDLHYVAPGNAVHTSGQCYFGPNVTQIQIPVTDAVVPPPPCARNATEVMVTLQARETNYDGQTSLVAGNIPELGNWDLDCAVQMTNASWNQTTMQWFATIGPLPVNLTFEYKFLIEYSGVVHWQCGDNRQFTVPSDTCGAVTIQEPENLEAPYFESGGSCS